MPRGTEPPGGGDTAIVRSTAPSMTGAALIANAARVGAACAWRLLRIASTEPDGTYDTMCVCKSRAPEASSSNSNGSWWRSPSTDDQRVRREFWHLVEQHLAPAPRFRIVIPFAANGLQ